MSAADPPLASHRLELRVRYEETDQMGVVYHANYLRYFEDGRTELLRDRGLTYRELEERGVLLAVVSAELRYKRAARYDDLLTVETELRPAGKTRVRFDYTVSRDGELLVSGNTVLACLGADRKPRRFPDELVAALGG